MYSTPLQEALAALPPLSEEERQQLLSDPGMSELTQVFGRLPDPRARLGRRYSLPFLLTCLVAALLCNCNSTVAVEEWCVAQQALLRRVFGPVRHLTPSGALYRRLLPRLPVAHLEWALAGWVRATRPAEDTEPVAVDGKTLRGARAGPGRGQNSPRPRCWRSTPTAPKKRWPRCAWPTRPMRFPSPRRWWPSWGCLAAC